MKEYDLERDDVLACIGYGAEMSRERYVDLRTLIRKSQRDFVLQPKVGALCLPWVGGVNIKPQRGCVPSTQTAATRSGLLNLFATSPRVALAAQPWALLHNPVGIKLCKITMGFYPP